MSGRNRFRGSFPGVLSKAAGDDASSAGARGIEDPAEEPSDAGLANLVREAAAAWTMPPRRFDPAAWHARVAGRAAGGRSARLRRLVAPASRPLLGGVTLAVFATLVVAIAAAVVSSTPRPAATARPSPSPVAASNAHPTPAPTSSRSTPTPQPVEIVGGPLPEEQLVVTDGGGWRLFSIASGTLGPIIQPSSEGVNGGLYALPTGGFVCACTSTSYQLSDLSTPGPSAALTQAVAVTVRVFDATSRVVREAALAPYVGAQDPQDEFAHETVGTHATVAPDGRTLYLGWIVRTGAGWRNGVDVIDITATPRVVQSVRLDTVPLVNGGVQLFAWTGPQVFVAPDGSSVLVVRPLDSGNQGGQFVDRFSAPLQDGRIGRVTKMTADSLSSGDCSATGPQGFAGSAAFYDLCGMSSSLTLRRVDLTGALLGDTPLPNVGVMGYLGSIATDSAGTTLYAWGPAAGTLTRVDLGTGTVTGSLTLPQTTAAARDPLSDLLARLVPSAVAKEILVPSIAIAPDGSRIYLIGTTSTDPAKPGESTGVWVVDGRTLTLASHWAPPRADLMSVALTPDSAFVVAAGRPGIVPGSSEQSSISVYEALSGRVRLFASQLGTNELFLGAGQP